MSKANKNITIANTAESLFFIFIVFTVLYGGTLFAYIKNLKADNYTHRKQNHKQECYRILSEVDNFLHQRAFGDNLTDYLLALSRIFIGNCICITLSGEALGTVTVIGDRHNSVRDNHIAEHGIA